jgi:hypothetical protein
MFLQEIAMDTTNVGRPATAGEFTARESQWFDAVKQLMENTVRTGFGFKTALRELSRSLRLVRANSYDMEAAPLEVVPNPSPQPQSDEERKPLRESEIEFFRDALGLIDFATRNGLTFSNVAGVLNHDVNPIFGHYGASLENAAADFFTPGVSGWAEKNREVFGASEE